MHFKIIFALLLTPIANCGYCADLPIVTDPISAHLTPSQNLRGYAMVLCFGAGFPNEKILQQETTRAEQFYFEKGNCHIDAYNETAAMAHAFLKKKYLSENGEQWTAMKCVDFFYSKEFAKLVEKYEKERIASHKEYLRQLKK
jgi:hypothetical protein